ncbi:MAG: S1-like domain-containing RNA-binding protein [Campylobacterota bacterium]|nr:S1-like domain-containing RNA-binding protein [Campylobacterota bacterium]
MTEKQKNLLIEIGKINTLEVMRDTEPGLYLQAKDDSEVLLPNAYVQEDEMPIGALIDVFVYTDSEDRPVATTKMPYAKLGEFGYFTVVDYKSYGAFVNWGLMKDLFVPLSQQKEYFTIGKKYILRVCLDEQTDRLYGTQKIGKWLERDMAGLHPNKEMDLLVIAKTPLGYKVVADNLYEGMLFSNEIFEPIQVGDRKKGFIKQVRKDFKLDITLQKLGNKNNQDQFEQKILKVLQEQGGRIAMTSKSDAEAITQTFAMSKKSFKRALNSLKEKKVIELDESTMSLKAQ